MPKSIKKKSKISSFQAILIAFLVYILYGVGNTYLPHKIFSLPSPTIRFEHTDATTFPLKFSFCYDFGNIFTDGKFVPYPKTCMDDLTTDADGVAHLPVNSITTKLRFAHIGNLNLTALGVKDNESCVYNITLLPDPWRSGIGGDTTSYGFSEVDGKTITIRCETDISLDSVKQRRTPPSRPE